MGATDAPGPAAFVIHGLAHLRAALRAGAMTGRAILAVTAPGASAYTGAGWFVELMEAGRNEFPTVALTALYDCGDRAGDAVMALGRGVSHLVFSGPPEAATRLESIAAETGATIWRERPEAFDLSHAADPDKAARLWCERLPAV